MLWQRVVTAVVLLLVLLPALFYPSPLPFCALAIVFVSVGVWEWARMVGYGSSVSVPSAGACALLCALAWSSGMLEQPLGWVWGGVALLWVAGGAWLLHGGIPRWSALARPLRLGFGFLILLAAWLAVAQARFIGINFLLSILSLVWVADIFAYFSGRAWGGRVVRRRLAPSISPGKTWEGVFGGTAAVVLLALGWRMADAALQSGVPSFYSQLLDGGRWIMLLAVVWLAAMSVVGDLIESLVKRAASVKDSSGLLPGHGGVLDRIDALLPTVPLAMLLHGV